jgi:predicted membrane protein
MERKTSGPWAAPLATLFALIACYGTVAVIALLGLLGITIALDEKIWAGAIVILAGLAFVALLFRWRRHRQLAPILFAATGFVLIAFVMLVSYQRIVELAGFILLSIGSLLDWRMVKVRGSSEGR